MGLVVDKKNGTMLGEQLAAAALTSDKAEDVLLGPPCPMECQHLWRMFLALHSTRSSNGFGGIHPITFTELDAYQRLTNRPLSPEEVHLIRAADFAACEQIAKNQDAEAPQPAETPPSTS